MTATVGRRGAGLGACRGTAAMMHDLGVRSEEDMASEPTYRGAEINIFAIQEEALIEQSGGLCIRAADEEASTANPINEAVSMGPALD